MTGVSLDRFGDVEFVVFSPVFRVRGERVDEVRKLRILTLKPKMRFKLVEVSMCGAEEKSEVVLRDSKTNMKYTLLMRGVKLIAVGTNARGVLAAFTPSGFDMVMDPMTVRKIDIYENGEVYVFLRGKRGF